MEDHTRALLREPPREPPNRYLDDSLPDFIPLSPIAPVSPTIEPSERYFDMEEGEIRSDNDDNNPSDRSRQRYGQRESLLRESYREKSPVRNRRRSSVRSRHSQTSSRSIYEYNPSDIESLPDDPVVLKKMLKRLNDEEKLHSPSTDYNKTILEVVEVYSLLKKDGVAHKITYLLPCSVITLLDNGYVSSNRKVFNARTKKQICLIPWPIFYRYSTDTKIINTLKDLKRQTERRKLIVNSLTQISSSGSSPYYYKLPEEKMSVIYAYGSLGSVFFLPRCVLNPGLSKYKNKINVMSYCGLLYNFDSKYINFFKIICNPSIVHLFTRFNKTGSSHEKNEEIRKIVDNEYKRLSKYPYYRQGL